MMRILATGMIAALVVGGAAMAQAPVVYTWTGYGVNVPGSSKCPTYKMNIEVPVTGMVGGGGMMDVSGEITDAGSKIKLDGYCKFEGPLTKKQ